jgi:hypothetical protein
MLIRAKEMEWIKSSVVPLENKWFYYNFRTKDLDTFQFPADWKSGFSDKEDLNDKYVLSFFTFILCKYLDILSRSFNSMPIFMVATLLL